MKKIFSSKLWKSSFVGSRAELILVILGLKRGTIIAGDLEITPKIIKKAGLDYYFINKPKEGPATFEIAKSEVLKEYQKRFDKAEKISDRRKRSNEFHKIHGWFLSYPPCCTKEYVRKRTPKEKEFMKNPKTRSLSYKFGRELNEQIKKTNSYPDIFDFRPPSFTPCSINCPNAIKLLKNWKKAIIKNDSEAALEMRFFNRSSEPENQVHSKFLEKHSKKIQKDYKKFWNNASKKPSRAK